MVNADAFHSSTGVAAGQRFTGVDTPDTRSERPCGRNVDGIELGVDALQLLPFLLEINPVDLLVRESGDVHSQANRLEL